MWPRAADRAAASLLGVSLGGTCVDRPGVHLSDRSVCATLTAALQQGHSWITIISPAPVPGPGNALLSKWLYDLRLVAFVC